MFKTLCWWSCRPAPNNDNHYAVNIIDPNYPDIENIESVVVVRLLQSFVAKAVLKNASTILMNYAFFNFARKAPTIFFCIY